MSVSLIIGLVVLLLLLLGGLVLFLTLGGGGSIGRSEQAAVSANLRSLVAAQRSMSVEEKSVNRRQKELAFAAAEESRISRAESTRGSQLTLIKRLRYAQWPINATQFRVIQTIVTLAVFVPILRHSNTIALQVLALFMPWLAVSSLLDVFVNKRFKAFDLDYPVLLMSYVGLLKTGMGTIQGLEAAARGLDEGSLVRAEVELLMERLRLGLSEEQALNAFGEDIPHPELELFVQSLLISRKVGGTLSGTLERLARQVRKRQQFRNQAVAAIGMERSSMYVIAAIMTALMMYLTWASPELVLPAFKSELGLKIFQTGLALIIGGFYWSRRVTNIKV